MMKILLKGAGLVLIVLAAMTIFGGHKAMAATYCDVLAPPVNPTSGTDANCLAGQDENALTSMGGTSDQLKQQLIDKITNYAENGYGFQKIGAQYIENHLYRPDPQSACKDWICNIKQPNVTFSIGNIPAAYNQCSNGVQDNTAYDTSSNSVIYISECVPSTTQTLIVTQEGNGIVFVIKLDCGNPMGKLPGPTLPKNTKPTGQFKYVNATCDGNYNIKVTFQDADGATSGYIGDSSGHKVRGTSISTTSPAYFTVPASVMADNDYGGNFWPVQLWVKDVGPAGTGDYVDVAAAPKPAPATGCNPQQTGTDCPGDSIINANTIVTIQTLYKTPYGSGSWSGRITSAKNNVQYQDVVISNSSFKSQDISIGGQREVPPITGYSSDKQSVTVDYQKFVSTYPYDHNQAEVTYKTNYNETTWKADTFDHWACNSGDTNHNNGKCTHTYNAAESCPSGGTVTAKGCQHEHISPATVNYTCPSGYQRRGSSPPYYCHIVGKPSSYNIPTTVSYTCSSGTLSGTNCITYTYTAITYSCNSGDTLSGTTCYHDYNATAMYRYTNQGTSSKSQNNSSNGYTMNACFSRSFDVTSVNVSATKNSNENPSSGSGSATVSITFSINPKYSQYGLRQPYQVQGLSYEATMYGQGLVCNSTSGTKTFGATTNSTSYTYVATATVPGVTCNVVQPAPLGGQVCADYDVSPTGTLVNVNGTITRSNALPIGGSGCSTPVINEPYLKVFGGDVAAGIGFLGNNGTSCSSSATASIQTFNTGTNPYGGSGTDLAALAVKAIATSVTDEGFATAQGGGVSGSLVSAPRTLSFGNNDPVSKYGGDYGTSTSNCSPDYYGAAPTQTAANSLAGPVNLASLDGTYVAAGTLQLSGTIAQGRHVLIYSAFPVEINGSVTFANSGVNVADMPSFSLIVKNSTIGIDGNVTSLAGNYIAQNGTINDCSGSGNIYADCSNKLTVYGSFVAQNIKFYRMGQNGSLRYSVTDSGPGANNASEEFDYSPATWLAQPPASSRPPAYDAVTSLPPVL